MSPTESAERTPTQKRGIFSRKPKRATDADSLSEVALVKPDEELIPPVSFSQLFRFSTRFELLLDGIGVVAGAAAGAAQPLMTVLFGNLVNQFVDLQTVLNQMDNMDADAAARFPTVARNFRHEASRLATYLVAIGCGMFLCTYIYMCVFVYTAEVNAKRIRERYLKAVLRQDVQFFDKVGAGEVATRIQTDTDLVQQGISEKVPLLVSFISSFLSGFVVAFVRSWRLALAMCAIFPCIAIIGTVMNTFMTRYMQISLKSIAKSGSLAEEVFSTIRTAQAFGTQKMLSRLYDRHIAGAHQADLKTATLQGLTLPIFFFITYNAYALAFSFGTTLINSGHATPGSVISVFMAILIGSMSLAQIVSEMEAINHGCGAAAKLFATIDRVPEIDSADEGGLKPEHVMGELVLDGVFFSYPSRPTVPVVKGLSLRFPAGKTAALVGASGSGKSTIIALVERFYDPTAGAVMLDGVNVKDLNLKWLRSQIGLVSQEPTLFATTIRGNVAHGLVNTRYEHASEDEKFALIKDACVKANADGFISNLPNGYDTMVGERGFLLSGGQKQRVAIARAVVSDPRLLLLDEATSALDTQSEGVVQDALNKAAAGRTTITIAHRLSTIKDANMIFVMGEGLVLEQGTHDELLNDENGAYTRLVQAQKLREQQDSVVSEAPIQEHGNMRHGMSEKTNLARKNSGLVGDLGEKLPQGHLEKNVDHGEYGLLYLFKRVAQLHRAGWRRYFLGSIFGMLSGCVYPTLGIVYALGINGFSLEGHARRVAGDRNALWFFIISILAGLSIGIQNYLFASAAATLAKNLRSFTFRAILRQDVEFFDKDENSAGGLTSTLSNNPQKVHDLAGVTLGVIVQSCATVVVGSIFGLVFVWKLGLVGIACTPFIISAGYVHLRIVVLKEQKNKKEHEASAQLACEAAAAIRTVASLTREDDCCDLYSKSLEEPLRRSNRSALWTNVLYAFSQSTVFFAIALVFWFGATLVSKRQCTVFQFFVGLMSTTFAAMQAGNVFTFVPDMSSAKGAASDIITLLDFVPEIDAESVAGKYIDANLAQGHIRLEGIHFRYPHRPGVPVLRGLSIQAEPGTYIALVGASGSGKSTVIQLIERFYNPLQGEIYLDNELITELNLQEYRKQIALVSQEPTLYAGTVRFNILLGAIKPTGEVTQEEIEEVCRSANILEFIQSLPDGFDTEVGSKGSQLSGGQKQRIAIARALLRNPKVLLLDEATSALDSNSEQVVQTALDQAAKGRTTIAVAHRLSTIQNAERIYFIKEGRVSESGSHDQLLSRGGDYHEFVRLQALSKPE
ncbi:P-loop containing nucleoside triphosphate hydrolase protein [Mycena crocata]|nr:P-loop containing nucleoside triphosphate hydrolase protein [Mycena crocata]